MSKNGKPDSRHAIELSTVYFFSGEAPHAIALKDCGVPMKSPMPGFFSGFYGYRGTEGFVAAHEYAEKHRLKFTIIDLQVSIDRLHSSSLTPEDLSEHDFISFERVARSTKQELRQVLAKHIENAGIDASDIDLSKPQLAIMRRPELIASVLDDPRWQHVKLLAYWAESALSEKSLSIGIVPYRHWGAIQGATCRLNPDSKVTIDPPSSSLGEKPAAVLPAQLN